MSAVHQEKCGAVVDSAKGYFVHLNEPNVAVTEKSELGQELVEWMVQAAMVHPKQVSFPSKVTIPLSLKL